MYCRHCGAPTPGPFCDARCREAWSLNQPLPADPDGTTRPEGLGKLEAQEFPGAKATERKDYPA